MGIIECAICNYKLRKDKALLDAKWEEIKNKYVCRDCAGQIAQMVLDEY